MSFTNRTTRTARQQHSITTRERPGPLAYDSLASDSIRDDGAFNDNIGTDPLSVRGYQSTLNNADTSAASEIPPATDAEARLPETGWRKERALGDRYEPLSQRNRPGVVAYNDDLDEPDISGLTDTGELYDSPPLSATIRDDFDNVHNPARASERRYRKRNYQHPVQAAQPGQEESGDGVYDKLPSEEEA